MSPTAQIYKGQYILFNGEPHQILDKEFLSPGKGSAFNKVKMVNLKTGKNINFTFKSGERVDEIVVNTNEYQYLYTDGNTFTFMDNKTYEQVNLDSDQIGDFSKLIKEGEIYMIMILDDKPIGFKKPLKVVREVIETTDAIKGNTATNATKKAKIETGIELDVPLFIQIGDKVAINTESITYVERAN